jgi:hypothetical protein
LLIFPLALSLLRTRITVTPLLARRYTDERNYVPFFTLTPEIDCGAMGKMFSFLGITKPAKPREKGKRVKFEIC